MITMICGRELFAAGNSHIIKAISQPAKTPRASVTGKLPSTVRFPISTKASQLVCAVVETVQQTLPSDVRIVVGEASGVLFNDTAMPLALILNELLTNGAKHGTRDPATGTVRVSLTEHEGQFELAVEDDGPGFELDSVRDTSSGLRLVRGFARQLQADFEVRKAPLRVSLRFAARGA
jgi:two-component sensor histidine kinase